MSGLAPAAAIVPTTPPPIARTPTRTPGRSSPRKATVKVVKRPGWHEPPLILQEYRLAKMVQKMDLARMPYPDARTAFGTPEICQMICVFADMYTIIAVSRVDRKRREASKRAFRSLFKATIYPFVFNDDFVSFVSLMNITGLGVTGSLLRILLMSNSTLQIDAARSGLTRWYRPDGLNIVVPRGQLDRARDWFAARGYKHFRTLIPFKAYRSSVVRIVGGVRPALLGQRTCRVTISESIGNIMHVMLAGPMSCWMNVITATRVYSVYPTLIASRHVLRSDVPAIQYSRRTGANYIGKADNRDWTGKCGVHCPALPRTSVGDKGIAFFPWNSTIPVPQGSRFPGTDSLLASAVIRWRLSARCCNDKCKHFIGEAAPL